MVRSGQKRDNKDDNKLAYTKRKTHGSDTIKAAGGGEGTILLKNQIAYDHNTTRSNRKRPIKMENSTDATLNYLESMVQELMRLLSMVCPSYTLFIYHSGNAYFQNNVLTRELR